MTRSTRSRSERGFRPPHRLLPHMKTLIRSNGVYDPAILKAVFLAGGPGSGKSHVASALFDIPNNSKVLVTTAATGLKIVNSDPLFEMYLRKMGVDPKILSSLSKEEFYELTETKTGPRIRAKEAANRLFESWLREKLGLLLDGTGDDFSKIKTKSDRLRTLGYDTKMLFVNTSLDVAKSRNRKRSRVLPDALVEETWYAVQNNLGLFQRYFGVENFVIVDASENGPPPVEALTAARRLLSRPLTNRIGLAWVRKELAARPGMSKRGGLRRPKPKPKPKPNPDECSMCQGTGIVSRYAHVEGGRCFACKGTGRR